MKTMLLNASTWDLALDSAGNMAVAEDPYSQAQDAASAIKLFEGELWYDTTKGIPYWETILGYSPPISYMQAKFVGAAKTVPGVTAARCIIATIQGRELRGQVQLTNSANQTVIASF